MKVEKRICDLCQNETNGKLAKLTAPKKWAAGDYADEPKPDPSARNENLFAIAFFGRPGEGSEVEVDVCRHCFKALFGAAAWLRELVKTGAVPK
jgi:hypothetical protein